MKIFVQGETFELTTAEIKEEEQLYLSWACIDWIKDKKRKNEKINQPIQIADIFIPL